MSKTIVILGAGESGTGAAVLAKKQGLDVFVSDAGMIKPQYKSLLVRHKILFEEEKHELNRIMEADEIVKSPGIPDQAEIILKIRAKGIPVISEIEFASRYSRAIKICVTGSNGKTTTTNLIHDMLTRAGLDTGIAGNVGKSFALSIADKDHDYFVLELSSFQLDGMFAFKADIAILLNITPDHLDRYGYDMERYIRSKLRILQNMGVSDTCIYCYDDPVLQKHLPVWDGKMNLLSCSQKTEEGQAAYVRNNTLMFNYKNQLFHMSVLDLALQGKHNLYNSMVAGITGQVLKIRKEFIRESLTSFRGVEHRLEPVLKVHDIFFINDSKATNINATWYALESVDAPIVWIAGGIDKGNDYNELKKLVQEKVKALICLGKDNSKLKKAFDALVPTLIETTSMEEAVQTAYFLGKKGDTVLLSPACASFDLFDNYEDRGRQFKKAVRNL
ncbi:MAG: UDP-N-acetylmuramoyl-L-alanine--D-glutamate ligase [Chlorobi bacterium]|nr:UDP-N-acetylmuramoyl-L-alanine--D-glutamate ligase [Chlorobiota bacterium]